MERNQFTFYRSYYEALKHLNKRDRAQVLMAVIAYALDETVPALTGVPLSVFTLIKPTLDSGRNKAKNRLGKGGTKGEQRRNEGEGEGEAEIEAEAEREGKGEGESEGEAPAGPDPAAAAVLAAYRERFSPTPSAACVQALTGYAATMGADCCLRAMDAALDAGKPSWAYLRGILRAKEAQGVRSLADWDRADADHQRRRQSQGSRPKGSPTSDDPSKFRKDLAWMDQFLAQTERGEGI